MDIKLLYLYLTWNCNLNCKHCWATAGTKSLDHIISDDMYKSIINNACDLGVDFIKISGGEPFLCLESLKTVVETSSNRGCDILIETNGTLLSEDIVLFLKKYNCTISISLDGNEEQHNDMRNNSTAFQRTLDGINLLLKNGLTPQIVYSFSVFNDDYMEEMIKFLNSLNIKELKLNPIIRLGRGTNFNIDSLHQEVMTVNALELLRIKNKYCRKSWNGLNIRIMLPTCFDGYSMLFNKNYSFISCPYEHLISVLPNGDVCLCGEAKDIKDFNYGNILESSLTEILNGSETLKNVKESIMYFEGICDSCVAKQICRGACRVVAYKNGLSLYASNPLCEELYKLGKFPFTYKK